MEGILLSLIEDSSFYQDRVFKGLFSKKNNDQERTNRIREFAAKLSTEHFSGKNQAFFTVISRYFYQTYNLISPADFLDAIKSSDDSTDALVFEFKQLLILFVYGEIPTSNETKPDGALTYITDAEFTYAIARLKEQTQKDLYGESLSSTMEILVRGKSVEKKHLQGFEDARLYYAKQLHAVEHVGGTELPQGTVNEEGEEIKQEYAKAKHGESTIFRVQTGVTEIDSLTGGGAPGEMWFLTGFTAEGKTTECINIAYNAMLHGQNVVFGTAETLREQVRRRLICRHSIHEKFHSPRGLTGDALKRGKLSVEEEILFNSVVDDLCTDPHYGKFKIVQIPKRCTVDYFSGLLAKYETEFYTHLAVWDELRLAGIEGNRGSRREELNDIITDAKQMAVAHRHHDGTVGLLLLAPYQVSRAHWQSARESGHYDKSCLSETSEAEKTADLIWSHLRKDDLTELTCQVLKYRDGADRTQDFRLEWRPEVCYIGSMANAHDDLLEG